MRDCYWLSHTPPEESERTMLMLAGLMPVWDSTIRELVTDCDKVWFADEIIRKLAAREGYDLALPPCGLQRHQLLGEMLYLCTLTTERHIISEVGVAKYHAHVQHLMKPPTKMAVWLVCDISRGSKVYKVGHLYPCYLFEEDGE